VVAFADLLMFGYFPRELPPVFTTVSLARELTAVNPLPSGAQKSSQGLPFSLGRVGGVRRKLTVPNPSSFAALAQAVSTNWPALHAHLAADKLSITSPSPGKTTGRALDPRFKLEAIPVRRAVTRAGARYIVQADVAKFYPSVYTHTIPWAAHGKGVAKQRRRDRSLYGNVLDECVRNCQDEQTVGLPIGPDTSFVLAELILSKVDLKLRGVASERNAFRYIDDYEIACTSYRQAEESLAALDEALKSYELELNDRKSRIVELPTQLYESWKDSLAKFVFASTTAATDREDIVRYFTTAFELRARHPDAYILNYAIGRLPIASTRPSSWRLVESLLLQCLQLEPGATRYVIAALMAGLAQGRRLNRDRIAAALSTHVVEHAPIGHSAELAWTLWGATQLKVPLSPNAANAVSKTEDAIVAVLALHAKRAKILPRGLETAIWRRHMSESGLYGPLWLLAYEANVHGWLPGVGGKDHVGADPFFRVLKARGVSFLDLTATSSVPRLRLGVLRAGEALYP
jgi:hypothetical protein